ncbi:hypothetical protein NHX12_028352 [Muraenolepis orangiensis]|uniref:C2 domain-containing protein n=1 Tax=Muraenolepis orangiensis TaxID=630683 RepID=A0A9Q0E9B9_9TELE|nr:hypothetical protein NHX12_028352 [Muraenolepis orangiensis]
MKAHSVLIMHAGPGDRHDGRQPAADDDCTSPSLRKGELSPGPLVCRIIEIPKMWLLDKIRDSMECLPQEMAHFVGMAEGPACLPPKTTLSTTLSNNILTPDKIPEFCLPPKLFRRKSPARTPEGPPEYCFQSGARIQKNQASPDTKHVGDGVMEACPGGGTSTANTKRKKPLPFSAEGYGLAGVHESPNTRRKESLFHGKCPAYVFDRSHQSAVQVAKRTQQGHSKNVSLRGLFPVFLVKSLSETGSTESETSSSSTDSTPIGSPYSTGSSLYNVLANSAGDLVSAGASSSCCSLVVKAREHRWRPSTGPSPWPHRLASAAASASGPGAHLLTLVPPTIFPLDLLHRQERAQREQILPLLGGGRVRLSAERTQFPLSSSTSTSTPSSTSSRPCTLRVRVVSVEGLIRERADRRPLSCALILCLVPGKLQLQKSATIRHCDNPVFNEDFFFTGLSEERLAMLELRLKVMDKPASGTLRRGTMMAVVTKPLRQLLPPSRDEIDIKYVIH